MANPPGTIGNDFFISTADPFDLINGSLGVDTVAYALATSGVSVDLNLAGFQAVGGGLGSDQLIAIENLIGSSFSDTLRGHGGANELRGGLGNDLLLGSAGNDLLDGGAGVNDIADYSGLGGAVRLGAFGVLTTGSSAPTGWWGSRRSSAAVAPATPSTTAAPWRPPLAPRPTCAPER
ncbi:MAG: hypothetical protein VKK97_03510 [Synechococcaceae cyanobacterium]|nr:hypothetical protein [Synechococcaceae cyanobacterium]